MDGEVPPLACDYPAWRPPVRVRLEVCEEHPCAYFPDRLARTRAFWAERLDPEVYHRFMDAGFRRSGRVIYQPICRHCRACLPIRVPVDQFRPSRSQRRVLRRNADLRFEVGEPSPSGEKFALYQRYQTRWHDGSMKGSAEEFLDFLYRSPVRTIETQCRTPDGRLLGVGICDVSSRSLSSVYFYFDPDEAQRSLGTWSILQEIELARRMGLRHYYLGYWVYGCRKMEYKASFFPHEVLQPDGRWQQALSFQNDAVKLMMASRGVIEGRGTGSD